MGKRGYNEDEVDAFLDRVEAALVQPVPDSRAIQGFQQGASVPPRAWVPPSPASPQPDTAPPRRVVGFLAQLAAIVGMVLSVLLIGRSVHDFHAYLVGTPATATIKDCIDTSNEKCDFWTGTWTVGGQSFSGPIGWTPPWYDHRDKIGVHVRGGKALTVWSGPVGVAGGVFVGLAAIGLGFTYGWNGRRFIRVVLPSLLAILGLLAVADVLGGLRFLHNFLHSRVYPPIAHALDRPAPSWVGLAFLALPVLLVAGSLWRSSRRRR
jgi:hypothetical protein